MEHFQGDNEDLRSLVNEISRIKGFVIKRGGDDCNESQTVIDGVYI